MKWLQRTYSQAAQFVPLLLTFALAAASYWYAHYNELNLFQTKRSPNPEVRDYYLKNFTVQVHDLAQNRFAIMQSEFAEHIPKTNTWHLSHPQFKQYEPNNVRLVGQALQGIYELGTDTLKLQRQVQLVSTRQGQSTQLKTEALAIDQNKRLVYGRSPLSLERGRQSLKGQGIELNNKTGDMVIFGPVAVRVNTNP